MLNDIFMGIIFAILLIGGGYILALVCDTLHSLIDKNKGR